MGLSRDTAKTTKNQYAYVSENSSDRVKKVSKGLIKRLFVYMKPYLGGYILGAFLLAIIVLFDILKTWFVSLSLEELGKTDLLGNLDINFKLVIIYFIVGVFLAISESTIQYFQSKLMHNMGNKIIYKIRADVFEHIQSLSHDQFYKIPVGTLVTRNTSDISVLYEMYTNVILNIFRYVITIIGVFIAMCLIDIKLALIVLCVFPVILGLTILFRSVLRKVHRNVRTEVSSMNAFLSENISGMKVTQIFNQEKKKYNEFKNANDRLKVANYKQLFTFGVFRPSIYFIYISTVILILYFGTNEAITYASGAILFSELYAFYQYISKFFNPIQSLADQYDVLQSSFAAAEKIFIVLDIEPEIKDSEDAIDIDLVGNIEFKNVWFSYIEDEWILKDVSFKINSKEAVAFVGATGAGKSTILGLITRNYDIQKGQILIDGIDIKKIKISSLRKQIGQMLQDVFLFSGNIAENIRLYDDSITDEEIIKACDEVNASHFINKNPEGLNLQISERGNNLSLGERQLVSFARVLVHKPKIMILDEATSNIDTETELLIQDSLEKVIKHNTMIMVAHRLSTIQHASNIFVFDHGRIIESGNHQELLKKRGRYYQLYMLQYEKDNK